MPPRSSFLRFSKCIVHIKTFLIDAPPWGFVRTLPRLTLGSNRADSCSTHPSVRRAAVRRRPPRLVVTLVDLYRLVTDLILRRHLGLCHLARIAEFRLVRGALRSRVRRLARVA